MICANMHKITKCNDLPQQNAKRPDVGLGGILRHHERFWRHPANWQASLSITHVDH